MMDTDFEALSAGTMLFLTDSGITWEEEHECLTTGVESEAMAAANRRADGDPASRHAIAILEAAAHA